MRDPARSDIPGHGHVQAARRNDRFAAGQLKTSHLVTHPMSLEDGPRGHDMFKHKKDGCVRAVLQPNGA